MIGQWLLIAPRANPAMLEMFAGRGADPETGILRYDAETMSAPKLVAKGADLMAARIRQIAAAAGVPILERPPLARALYETMDVGQEIPERFYQAVAEILAFVYELTGRKLGPQPVPVA